MLKPLIFLTILIVIASVIFYQAMSRQARRDVGYLPGIIFASIAFFAFLSPQLIVLHIVVLLLPIVLGRTKLKAGIVVAVGFYAMPAFASNVVLGGVNFLLWTFQSTLGVGGLIAFLLAPGKAAPAPPWADIAMALLIAILVVAVAREGPLTGYPRQLATYVFIYVIPVYVITRSARTAIEWRTLLTALAGAGVILAVVVLYEARGGWPLYAPLAGHYGIEYEGIIVKWRGGMMRAYGPMGEATAMGFVLVICFAAALAVRRSFASNYHYIAVVALIALGTLAPQSRGGIIGLAVAFVVSAFYRRGINSVVQIGGAASLVIGAYLGAMAFGSVGAQFNTSLQEAKGTGDYRELLFTRGMQEFWKNPITGDTYNNVVSRMQDLVQGEKIVDFVNSYLYFALFTGFFGFVAFCLVFILPMTRLLAIRTGLPSGSAERELGGFCAALIASSAVMFVFTSLLQRPTMVLLVATGAAFMIPRVRPARRKVAERVRPLKDPQPA